MRVAVALGSNLGDRAHWLQVATDGIAQIPGVRVISATTPEETPAFGPPQPSYLNQMLLLETALAPAVLLAALHVIETQHGRARVTTKGPRTIDLDIVWIDGVMITTPTLLVPHPGLLDRTFWQVELAMVLGHEAAARAIATARIHAGRDTADTGLDTDVEAALASSATAIPPRVP